MKEFKFKADVNILIFNYFEGKVTSTEVLERIASLCEAYDAAASTGKLEQAKLPFSNSQ